MSFWRPLGLALFMSIGIGLLTHPIMIAIVFVTMAPLFWFLDRMVFARPRATDA